MRSVSRILGTFALSALFGCGMPDADSLMSDNVGSLTQELKNCGTYPYWCAWDGSGANKCQSGGSYVGKYVYVRSRGDGCVNLRHSWSDRSAPVGGVRDGTRAYIHRQIRGGTVSVHGITTDWWYLTNDGWITAAYTSDTNGL